jgi:hypothetical protein
MGEHLEWSAGLRLQTTDDITTSSFDPTSFAESLGGSTVAMEGSVEISGSLPMAGVAWKWKDGHQAYFRYSPGMHPGGLAVASGGSVDYKSEYSSHFEVGHPHLSVSEHACGRARNAQGSGRGSSNGLLRSALASGAHERKGSQRHGADERAIMRPIMKITSCRESGIGWLPGYSWRGCQPSQRDQPACAPP